MATIRNMIRRAFRQIGIVGANEDVFSEDLDIAKESISALLASWSTNPDIQWTKDQTEYSINQSDAQITLQSRPINIQDITFNINNVVFPMTQLDYIDFYRISVPNSGIPSAWMWDGDLTIKIIGRGTGKLNVISQLPLFDITTDIDQELTFPPGYENAIVYNTAIMLSTDYQREPSQTLIALAQSSLDAILSPNNRPSYLKLASSSMFGGGRGSDLTRTSLAALRG